MALDSGGGERRSCRVTTTRQHGSVAGAATDSVHLNDHRVSVQLKVGDGRLVHVPELQDKDTRLDQPASQRPLLMSPAHLSQVLQVGLHRRGQLDLHHRQPRLDRHLVGRRSVPV